MPEKTEKTLTVKFHYVSERGLTQEERGDLLEIVVPEIVGQIRTGCLQGQVEMDRGGYCEWRLDYNGYAPQP